MPSTPILQTVRVTSSTRLRADNMLKTIQQFKERKVLDNVDLQAILHYSASGTRKYITDLLRLQIITIEAHGSTLSGDRSQYRLVDDEARIARFEDELKAHIATASGAKALRTEAALALPAIKARPTIQQRFPDRHIHLASDDMATGVRLVKNEGEGRRDHLVAALFGPARTPGTTIEVKAREIQTAA